LPLPLFSVPFFRLCIVFLTDFCAPLPYLAISLPHVKWWTFESVPLPERQPLAWPSLNSAQCSRAQHCCCSLSCSG
jgi:hypothetical protein